MCLDVFHNLWKPLVLLLDVLVPANVDEVDDLLGREEEVSVEDFNVLGCPGAIADWGLGIKEDKASLKYFQLFFVWLRIGA